MKITAWKVYILRFVGQVWAMQLCKTEMDEYTAPSQWPHKPGTILRHPYGVVLPQGSDLGPVLFLIKPRSIANHFVPRKQPILMLRYLPFAAQNQNRKFTLHSMKYENISTNIDCYRVSKQKRSQLERLGLPGYQGSDIEKYSVWGQVRGWYNCWLFKRLHCCEWCVVLFWVNWKAKSPWTMLSYSHRDNTNKPWLQGINIGEICSRCLGLLWRFLEGPFSRNSFIILERSGREQSGKF